MAETEGSPFWELAEPHLVAGAEQSTMMGHPCLRIDGEFFASLEPKGGDMIVKLPAHRVDELVEAEVGNDFAPAGRRFKEWCAIPEANFDAWEALMDEARAFVAQE